MKPKSAKPTKLTKACGHCQLTVKRLNDKHMSNLSLGTQLEPGLIIYHTQVQPVDMPCRASIVLLLFVAPLEGETRRHGRR